MAQPGTFQPRGEDFLIRKLQELEARVARNEAANVFGLTGIKPKDGGTDLDGFVNINGPLEVNGDSTINGPLEVNGDSVFNGELSINGPLNLQPGSIENDALTDPVQFGQSSTIDTNFALAFADVEFAAGSIAIPAGYTRAQVTVIAVGGAINPNPTDDFLYAKAIINGVASRQIFGYVAANNGSVEVMTAKVSFLTGLSGGSITVGMMLSTQTGSWAAQATNRAFVEASAIFLR
jgi:hypothetical protein